MGLSKITENHPVTKTRSIANAFWKNRTPSQRKYAQSAVFLAKLPRQAGNLTEEAKLEGDSECDKVARKLTAATNPVRTKPNTAVRLLRMSPGLCACSSMNGDYTVASSVN